jgi:hypothetical protein
MDDGPTIHPLVRLLDEHLDASLDRIERGLAPVWDAQLQMGKTLITLASSALVLSISLIHLLADKITHPTSTWLLPLSWFLFAITVLAGTARHGWAGAARSFRARLEGRRGAMRTRVMGLSSNDPQLSEKFDAVLDDEMRAANVDPAKGVRVHDVLNHVMFWSFALGLAALLVFALRNSPL